ncbi:MAG TPA: hypothetical protein VMH40_10880 [Myxococcaceae bacterium]|nr:hypothetical protein [Myxococcaceae bacterium]
MRWSELGVMRYLGRVELSGQVVEVFQAADGSVYQVRRDVGVFREIRPGEQLGDFERWDLLMPDPLGATAGS